MWVPNLMICSFGGWWLNMFELASSSNALAFPTLNKPFKYFIPPPMQGWRTGAAPSCAVCSAFWCHSLHECHKSNYSSQHRTVSILLSFFFPFFSTRWPLVVVVVGRIKLGPLLTQVFINTVALGVLYASNVYISTLNKPFKYFIPSPMQGC